MSNRVPILLYLTLFSACATVSHNMVASFQPGSGGGVVVVSPTIQAPAAVTAQSAVADQPVTKVTVTFQASAKRVAYLKEAFSEIVQLLTSPELARQIEGLATQSLATTADAECKVTSLPKVLTSLQNKLPAKFTIKSRPSISCLSVLPTTSV